MMKAGISLTAGLALAEYPRLARLIEDLGFDHISVQDNLSQRGAWTVATIVAQNTSRVLVGPGVVSPFIEHPVRVAGEILTLHELSDGRAMLGIGRGSLFELLGMKPSGNPEILADALRLIRHVALGKEGGFESRHFPLAPGFRLRWRAEPAHIRLWAGTSGERTVRALSPVADCISVAGLWRPEGARTVRSWMPPGQAELGASIWTVLGANGLAAARSHVALRAPFMRPFLVAAGVDARELERIGEALVGGGVAAAAAQVSETTVRKLCASGDAGVLVEGIRGLREAGVTQVSFGGPFGIDVEVAIAYLGREVLPRIRSL